MKALICGAAMCLSLAANEAGAEQTLVVDGTEYPLSALMMTCQAIEVTADQVECFNNISKMLGEQAGRVPEPTVSVPEALEALRVAAEYRDDETGLLIAGTDCNLRILYYGNYFHVSRRNISEIDVIAASFDAAKLQPGAGGQGLLAKGTMEAGTVARVSGGTALDSSQNGFAPKSPRMTMAEFAEDVARQLPPREGEAFDFVLVHPARSEASAEIWDAFGTLIKACGTVETGVPSS